MHGLPPSWVLFGALTLASSTLACGSAGAGSESGAELENGCSRLDGSDPHWALRCGGPRYERLVGLVVDDTDGVVVGFSITEGLGASEGAFVLGELSITPEEDDFVLTRFDAAGEVDWVRHVGGPGTQALDRIDRCGDGFVITGYNGPGSSTDLGGAPIEASQYVAVLDDQGALVWSRAITPAANNSAHVSPVTAACSAEGSVVMTGNLREGADFGGGQLTANALYDGFVVRYDASGEHLWSQLFGGDGFNAIGTGIAWTPTGEIIVAGHFEGNVDFGTGIPLSSTDGEDVVLAKLDADGNTIWFQQIGAAGLQYARAVAVDADGEIAVAGIFLEGLEIGDESYSNVFPNAEPDIHGTVYDGFIATFDPDGNPTWSTTVASMLDDDIYELAYDGTGALLVGAFVNDERVAVRHYLGGAMADEWTVAGIDQDARPTIAFGPGGLAVLGGYSSESIDLSLGTLEPHGGDDLLVIKRGE